MMSKLKLFEYSLSMNNFQLKQPLRKTMTEFLLTLGSNCKTTFGNKILLLKLKSLFGNSLEVELLRKKKSKRIWHANQG